MTFRFAKSVAIKLEVTAPLQRPVCARTAGEEETAHNACPTGIASTATVSTHGSAIALMDSLDRPVVTPRTEMEIGEHGDPGQHAAVLVPGAEPERGPGSATTRHRLETERIAR